MSRQRSLTESEREQLRMYKREWCGKNKDKLRAYRTIGGDGQD